MTDILLKVFLCIVSIGEVWLCYQFFYSFYLSKKYRPKLEIAIMWMNIAILGILLALNRNIVFFSYAMLIFCILINTVFAWLIKRKDFISILGINVFFYSLLSWLDLFFGFLGMGFVKADFEREAYIQPASIMSILVFVSSRVVLGVILFLVYKNGIMSEVIEYKNVFSVIGIVLCVLLRKYQTVMVDMTTGEQEMRAGNSSISLLVVLSIVLMAGVFVSKYTILKKEKALLQLKDELIEEKYQALIQNKQLLHDMKNHLIVIKECEKTKDWDRLNHYIDEISDEYVNSSTHSWTGNVVLDLLLNQKLEKATLEGIDFRIEAGVMHWIPLSDSEIISLYGNLLDNAIEACELIESNEKQIILKTEKKKEMLFIQISNSFSTSPVIKNGKFVTQKKEKGIHGFGIERIKRIVDKHDGLFSYHIEGNMFEVCISFFDSEIDHK